MGYITCNLGELYLPDANTGGASNARCASASLLPLENCILIYGAGGTWQGDRMRHLEVQSSNIDTHADAKSYSVLEMRV